MLGSSSELKEEIIYEWKGRRNKETNKRNNEIKAKSNILELKSFIESSHKPKFYTKDPEKIWRLINKLSSEKQKIKDVENEKLLLKNIEVHFEKFQGITQLANLSYNESYRNDC